MFLHSYDIKYSYLTQVNCIKLYGFKYSYLILIIFKEIYLTHKWSEPGSNDNKMRTLHLSELKPHHQTQFCVVTMTLILGGSYPPAEDAVNIFKALLTGQLYFLCKCFITSVVLSFPEMKMFLSTNFSYKECYLYLLNAQPILRR